MQSFEKFEKFLTTFQMGAVTPKVEPFEPAKDKKIRSNSGII